MFAAVKGVSGRRSPQQCCCSILQRNSLPQLAVGLAQVKEAAALYFCFCGRVRGFCIADALCSIARELFHPDLPLCLACLHSLLGW